MIYYPDDTEEKPSIDQRKPSQRFSENPEIQSRKKFMDLPILETNQSRKSSFIAPRHLPEQVPNSQGVFIHGVPLYSDQLVNKTLSEFSRFGDIVSYECDEDRNLMIVFYRNETNVNIALDSYDPWVLDGSTQRIKIRCCPFDREVYNEFKSRQVEETQRDFAEINRAKVKEEFRRGTFKKSNGGLCELIVSMIF